MNTKTFITALIEGRMGDLARTMINTGTRARERKEIRLPRLPFGLLLSFHSWVATTIFVTSIFVECGNCCAGSWVCDRPGGIALASNLRQEGSTSQKITFFLRLINGCGSKGTS